MEVTFTRSDERSYTTIARRDDGVTLRVPAFDHPTWIPHELAHVVIEQALGLHQGFWGCVAAGVVFPGMTVISGRRPPHAAERSHGLMRAVEAGQYGTQAEVLAGFFVQPTRRRLETDWAQTHVIPRNLWQPSRSPRITLRADEVRHVCAELRAMQERWRALATGRSITMIWPARVTRRPPAVHGRSGC